MVLDDQTALRLAEKQEKRTDWVMNRWGSRNGRVGDLVQLLEGLELLRPRDVILNGELFPLLQTLGTFNVWLTLLPLKEFPVSSLLLLLLLLLLTQLLFHVLLFFHLFLRRLCCLLNHPIGCPQQVRTHAC